MQRDRVKVQTALSLLVLPLLCYAHAVLAATAPERPPSGAARLVAATRTAEPPLIDGRLEEPVWKAAGFADGFWVSAQDGPPTEQTEVRVLVDGDWLYVAFRVFDREPGRIEAQQTRRDGGVGFDDHVTVELDTFSNSRDISTFSANAIGTQQDSLAGGRARHIGWRGDWRAAAARTRYGWSVEMAIPFAILNFPSSTTEFRANFYRYHNRTGERSYWADVTPQSKREEMGRLVNLGPHASTPSRWTLMPYALAGWRIPNREGKVQDRVGSVGMDVRYRPTPGTTGVLSLNPDFSQIESQFASLNFSYTEKLITDPRPFFQEGYTFLDAGRKNLYFYTNRIPNFDAGGRFFGRLGRTQIGLFGTTSGQDGSDYGLRLFQELNATNSAALSFYGTERTELTNNVVVAQASGRQPSGFNYAVDAARTETKGLDGGGKHGRALLGWSWDYWFVGGTADHFDRDFAPATGLLPRDLPGTRGATAYGGYYRVYGEGPIYSARADATWTGRDTLGGQNQQRSVYLGGYLEFRNEVRTSLFYFSGDYRPVTSVPAVFGDVINEDHYFTAMLDFNTRSSRLGYGFGYSDGFLGGGKYRYVPAYVWYRPRRDLYLSLTTEFLESFGTSDQTIVTAKWDITPTDALGMRVVNANGARYYRLIYGRQVRRGVDVIAVMDKQAEVATQFSVKLVFSLP